MDRNLIFQHILTKIYWKNTFKISLQYLENELRHLCPLNPIPMPDFCFDGFRDEDKFCFVNVVANPPRSSAGWGGLAVANAFRNRLLSSSPSPCLTCSIYVVWNCFETGPDLGSFFLLQERRCGIDVAYILVGLVDGCQVIWGSCAIYVGICSLISANGWELRHLCPEKLPIFCNLLRWFPPYFFLNIKPPFWDIDGATPTHSPKSGCKCPHRWRNSLISPDIHQPT